MQTLIDISETDIALLNKLSQDRKTPRDELVRTAVSAYLDAQLPKQAKDIQPQVEGDEAFGLWADFAEDGLAYQERIRSAMGTLRPLFDSNILIDYLKIDKARNEIDRLAEKQLA